VNLSRSVYCTVSIAAKSQTSLAALATKLCTPKYTFWSCRSL